MSQQQTPAQIDASEIIVYEPDFEFSCEGYTANGRGTFYLRLAPRPRVEMRALLPDVPEILKLGLTLSNKEPEIRINGDVVSGFFHYAHDKDSTVLTFEPRIEPYNSIVQSDKTIKTIHARLFSFPNYIRGNADRSEKKGSLSVRINVIELNHCIVSVNISSFFDNDDRVKKLRESGRHQQTHGVIIKSNATISVEIAKTIVEDLNLFLSFATGNYVRLCCVVGMSENCDIIWSHHASPTYDARSTVSWFDRNTASQLVDLFPLWVDRLKNERWRLCLTETIRLYIMANDPSKGIEGPIVLAQTAIERISFEYFVHDKTMLSSDGFQKLKASDRMRMLIASMSITIGVDDLPDNLRSLGSERNWPDLLEGLAQIRNSIVHPEYKNREIFTKAKYDAWIRSLWLLELAILWSIGYQGTYSNRTKERWVGDVEQVPWATIDADI